MKTILVMILAVAPFYGFSQVKIYNTYLVDSTKKVMYLGVANVLKVEGKNLNIKECSISIDNARVIAVENNHYDIRPEVSGVVVVNFYEKGELVLSEKWDVKRIPADIKNRAEFKLKFKNTFTITTAQKL